MFDIIRSASPFPFIPVSLRRDKLQLPGTLDPYVMSQGTSVIIRTLSSLVICVFGVLINIE